MARKFPKATNAALNTFIAAMPDSKSSDDLTRSIVSNNINKSRMEKKKTMTMSMSDFNLRPKTANTMVVDDLGPANKSYFGGFFNT